MKATFVILLLTALAGCASNQGGLPSLQGKPRIKINAPQPEVLPVLVSPAGADATLNNTKE